MKLDGKSFMIGALCAFGAMLTVKKIAGKNKVYEIKKEIKEYEKNKQELSYEEKEKMLKNIINRIDDMLVESNLYKEEKRELEMLRGQCQFDLIYMNED